jgi:hypothetical protein
MGRKKGAVNYKNDLLINIIAEILPNGEYGWQAVATAYQEASKEDAIRETDDLRRHWIKNLCNGMNKPTGRRGEPGDCIHKCIAIERLILNKTHSGLCGVSTFNESDESVSDDKLFSGQRSARNDDDDVNTANENEEEDFVGENNVLPGILPALPEEIAPDLAELGASAAAGNNSTAESGGKLDTIVTVSNYSTTEGGGDG